MRRSKPLSLILFASALLAQGPSNSSVTPPELEGVSINERLGESIDLNLEFVAENGYPAPLRSYFRSGRPVVLNLVYYSCPMLCNLVLNGQVQAMRDMPWTPGEQYEVVTVSIDPTENYGLARDKKAAYLASFERPAPGWHFLADYQGNVAKLARQVGFGYRLDPSSGQYAHAAAIFILTPDGKIARYLYGTRFKPFDMRLALTEASEGKSGMSVERFLLLCFHYDPARRGYVVFAQNFMRGGGVLMVLIMSFVLFRLFRRERQRAASLQGMVTAR